MAESSDALIKNEIIQILGFNVGELHLKVFPQGSNDDQKLVENGGLTFSVDGVNYGSCDAMWFTENEEGQEAPFIGLEGTDCLSRKSAGNAQYQRFHHALGAVKKGLIGIYYLRKGACGIQPDLYGMAVNASRTEKGYYLIVNDLSVVKDILLLYSKQQQLTNYLDEYVDKMERIFLDAFKKKYNNDWDKFTSKRSSLIIGNYIIKHAARMVRNFTDSSQRAGHIAVGEMYLTKYFFPDLQVLYFFPKMTQNDLNTLDRTKSTDKEWSLLRNEKNVTIITIDNIDGIQQSIRDTFFSIKDTPSKDQSLTIYNENIKDIMKGLSTGEYSIVLNDGTKISK